MKIVQIVGFLTFYAPISTCLYNLLREDLAMGRKAFQRLGLSGRAASPLRMESQPVQAAT